MGLSCCPLAGTQGPILPGRAGGRQSRVCPVDARESDSPREEWLGVSPDRPPGVVCHPVDLAKPDHAGARGPWPKPAEGKATAASGENDKRGPPWAGVITRREVDGMADRNHPLPTQPDTQAGGHPGDLPLRRGAAGGKPPPKNNSTSPTPEAAPVPAYPAGPTKPQVSKACGQLSPPRPSERDTRAPIGCVGRWSCSRSLPGLRRDAERAGSRRRPEGGQRVRSRRGSLIFR
jgi:hypothetical protein